MATLPTNALLPAAAAAADSDELQQVLGMTTITQRTRLDVQAVHTKVTEKFDTLSGTKLGPKHATRGEYARCYWVVSG